MAKKSKLQKELSGFEEVEYLRLKDPERPAGPLQTSSIFTPPPKGIMRGEIGSIGRGDWDDDEELSLKQLSDLLLNIEKYFQGKYQNIRISIDDYHIDIVGERPETEEEYQKRLDQFWDLEEIKYYRDKSDSEFWASPEGQKHLQAIQTWRKDKDSRTIKKK